MESTSFHKSWGAEWLGNGTIQFRLWASGQPGITLRLAGKDLEMRPCDEGWFELTVENVAPGTEYQYVLNDGMTIPDPASRAHRKRMSMVRRWSLTLMLYRWQHPQWQGRPWEETVVYEPHRHIYPGRYPPGSHQETALSCRTGNYPN